MYENCDVFCFSFKNSINFKGNFHFVLMDVTKSDPCGVNKVSKFEIHQKYHHKFQ